MNFLESTTLGETFDLPMSLLALEEVRDIQTLSTHMYPSSMVNDVCHYVWGKTNFRSTDYYRFCFKDAEAHPAFRCLWSSQCIMRTKVFGCLLFHDRLNTCNMSKRRHYNIGDDHDCLLCGNQVEETVDHMIFRCPFSRVCWRKLGIDWTTSTYGCTSSIWSSKLGVDHSSSKSS